MAALHVSAKEARVSLRVGVCVCACMFGGWVTDTGVSPQGALQGAIDKDSLGKFFSLVLRHSSVIQWCQVTICHETHTEKGFLYALLLLFGYVTSVEKIISLACNQTKASCTVYTERA